MFSVWRTCFLNFLLPNREIFPSDAVYVIKRWDQGRIFNNKYNSEKNRFILKPGRIKILFLFREIHKKMFSLKLYKPAQFLMYLFYLGLVIAVLRSY